MRVWGWGKPSEAVVRLGVARAAVAGAKRQELMQEALQTVLSIGCVDRAGVWMEADADAPSLELGFSPDFQGIVADRDGEALPPECARLPYEAPTLRELLKTAKSIEEDLERSREPLMIRALVEMRRALWTPVVSSGRVRGVLFAGTRKRQATLPVPLVESVAAELALASDLEETRRFSRERQQDLAAVRRFLTTGSAQPLTETLTTLVKTCTDPQGGPGALFAAIGHWEFPDAPSPAMDQNVRASHTDGPTAGRVMKFPWRSGDNSWTRAMESGPLRDLWQRAIASHRVAGVEPGSAHTQPQIARVVAVPLEAEGESLGVLVAGISRAASSLASLERLELVASLAASALLHQRRDEEGTRAAAQREALLQTSDQAIVLLGRDGNIAGLSLAARDLLRETTAALRPEGAPEEWLRDALHAKANGKLPEFPKDLSLPNGRVLPVRTFPIGADGEATLLLLGPVWDTSQPRDSSQVELANVIEWLEEGVVLFDAQQHIRVMNSRFAQIAGLKPEEMSAVKTFDDLLARLSGQAADPQRFAQDWSELAHGIESGRRDELELARPVPRMLERAARPILDARGVLLGRVEIYRDVTAQHAFQTKLLQTEKLASLGQMLTSIVHELSNPLTTILGYAQRLLLRSDARGHSAEARQIYEEAERASTILRQVLLTARGSRPERRGVALNEVVARTMELQRFGLTDGKVRIELDLDPALPSVEGDAGQLQQVLMNLVGNARQALESKRAGGRIIVRTKPISERRVLLEVQDNGPGIPQALLARIFDPFFTTKPAGIGTGLGLAIVLGIVREHGGQVRVTSPPGAGAKFSIELPAIVEARTADAGEREKSKLERFPPPLAETLEIAHAGTVLARWAGARILVVEDEPTVAQLIADVLEEEGLHVEVLLDGREALRRAGTQKYDLVICDMKMPGVDGQRFFESLTRGSQDALSKRFLFVTGDVLAAHTREFLERNGLPHVAKPFRVEELTGKVRQVLAETRPKGLSPSGETRTKVARK